MKLYVSHSTGFDYKNELYEPLRKSDLNSKYELILPHEHSDDQFSSKKLFEGYETIVLGEVSLPSTGQGIELGWANSLGKKIITFAKKDFKNSKSFLTVSDEFFEYENSDDLINKLVELI